MSEKDIYDPSTDPKEVCVSPIAPQLPPTKPCRLLSLPFEIRLQIYHYCIPQNRVVHICLRPQCHSRETYGLLDASFKPDGRNNNAIFLLSKQISAEALDVLYEKNFFTCYLREHREFSATFAFGEENRRRIRHLLVVAPADTSAHIFKEVVKDRFWSSIIPQLKALGICAEHPVIPSSFSGRTLKEDTAQWSRWFGLHLDRFRRHLTSGTVVRVDDNGQQETGKLFREHLVGGYEEVRLRDVKNWIFKTGRLGWFPRYWDGGDFAVRIGDIVVFILPFNCRRLLL